MSEPWAVQRSTGTVLFDDMSIAKVTNWIGADGADTSDPQLAVAAVVQNPSHGGWHTLDMAEYESQPLQ